MVSGRQRLARASKQQMNSKEREQPNSVTSPSQRELPPIWKLQQSIGNSASSQLLQHITHTAPMTTATEGLNVQLKQLVLVLALQAEQAGEALMWSQFEALSVGQRQSLLIQWYGVNSDFTAALHTSPDWQQWQTMIRTTKHITLQLDEPQKEADVTALGVSEPQYTMNSSGLLVPYREAWLWLNYKGNKQGQAYLLHKLDSLSIPKKQLLLHKLNGSGQLTLYQLSNNVTIEEHLKQWVDWKHINEALHGIMNLNNRQVERQLETVQQEQSTSVLHYEPEQDELEQEADGASSWLAALGIFGLEDEAEEEAKVNNQPQSMEQILGDADKMFQLLFGIPFNNGKQPITIGNRAELIDRFLEIDHKLPTKQQEAQRMQKLKAQGYASVNQLYMLLKISIIEILYRLGTTRKDEKYIIILQKLGLLQGKKATTKDHIAARIHSI
ncbi:MAG TPA: hypothetical protein IAA29_04825 [Candidatus Paenibacillus intestinavium]|nr:hypothetical protein [Candidatus Paenibacillus intestinavium]